MPSPGDPGDTDTPALGATPPSHSDTTAAKRGSLVSRVVPVVFILGALAAATAVALGSGAVKLPGSADAAVSSQQAQAAVQMEANQRWASATCTTVVGWKNEIGRDLHGLTLSLAAIPRVEAAIGATTKMLDSVEKLALPPALKSAQGRALVQQLRSDIQSRVHAVENAASSVAGGNFSAIGSLLSDLGSAPSMEGKIAGHLRGVAADLGVSLASSPSCRQLVGLKL